jgi:hypothetical protein
MSLLWQLYDKKRQSGATDQQRTKMTQHHVIANVITLKALCWQAKYREFFRFVAKRRRPQGRQEFLVE